MANDLDQSISNAIAGGVSAPVDLIAWALRKAGVPGLEKPVGGADWMAEKGLTRPVQQGSGQVVGETIGNLADPLSGLSAAAKGAAAIKAGLYASALRPELITSHSVELPRLMKKGQLPWELYNPSFAVTKDSLGNFAGSGSVRLVGQEGLLDPKTSSSVLTAFDAYSPRWASGAGNRSDWLHDELAQYAGKGYDAMSEVDRARLIQMLLRENANGRLTDKFISSYPKGGIFGESAGKPRATTLPHYGKGGYKFNPTMSPQVAEPLQEFSYGHRFPTFQAYEKSPYGAERLNNSRNASDVYDDIRRFLRAADGYASNEQLQILQHLARGETGRAEAYNIRKSYPDATKKAQQLLRDLRVTKSQYGELKGYGPLQINKNNIAGVIDTGSPPRNAESWYSLLSEQLRMQAEKRGIPYEKMPTPDNHIVVRSLDALEKHEKKVLEVARQMQALRK